LAAASVLALGEYIHRNFAEVDLYTMAMVLDDKQSNANVPMDIRVD
jgi:hypothetical protein